MDKPAIKIDDQDLMVKVETFLSPLFLDKQKAEKLEKVFISELDKGLEHGLDGSSIQMENTYIPEILDGSEEGQYLALDLGGTNFRVILLKLKKGKIVDEIISYYTVDESLRLGPGVDLFNFLAECIKDFLQKNKLSDEKELALGFTFSFPMLQHALDIGVLVNWTKSFNCSGVVGEDVVAMLNTALRTQGIQNVKVVAILNDTTGTLVAGSHDHPDCAIGLILGTGTNGSYFEKASRVVRWETEDKAKDSVIMDPEWGAFGDNGTTDFLKSRWDVQVDKESLLPGSFTYEKSFAGKYLGELTRLVLKSLWEEGLLSGGGAVPEQLGSANSLTTSEVSLVGEDTAAETDTNTKNLLTKLGIPATGSAVQVTQYLCQLLIERAALLVSVPMATFLNRMARPHTAIAVTGSLYKLHPTLPKLLDKHIARLSSHKFEVFLCDDGSGKGAGLVAAIATRLKKQKN